MPQKTKFRADCKTCEEYVGPKQNSKPEAEADRDKHLNDGNDDHDVTIQIIQG